MTSNLFPLTHWNGKPITDDTATVDLVTTHANIWNTVITCGRAHRLPALGKKYVWEVTLIKYPAVLMTTSETRRRAIDGSLYTFLRGIE